jgi:P-type conjugative transfer protein TrbJ
MNGTLKSLNMSYKDLKEEKKLKNKLATHARSTHGQMEAAQVANEIAAEEVNQLQKLRQILITSTNAQVEYQAFQAQKESSAEESFNKANQ